MLSNPVAGLLKKFKGLVDERMPAQTQSVVRVDEVISKVAHVYEKIRSLVEYQEEHLIRKMFIFRTVRRKLFVSPDRPIAESIIKELIRAGHLANESVPETKIIEVQDVIDNYHRLGRALHDLRPKQEQKIADWLLDITVSAVEERIFLPTRDKMLSDLMYQTLKQHLSIPEAHLSNDEVNLQLFIGVQRGLLRADRGQLQYRLLKLMYPNWNKLAPEQYTNMVTQLPAIKQHLERSIKSSFASPFLKLCSRYNTVYYLIGDIMDQAETSEKLETMLHDEEALERTVKTMYDRRFKKERGRLHRMAFLSVISFFFSKIAITLAIEIPIEQHITHTFSLLTTVISVFFPPVLMMFVVSMIKMPSTKNVDLVIDEVKKAVYENLPKEYIVRIPKKKNTLTHWFAQLFYFLMFIVSFALVYKALILLHFSSANIIIFSFFTSLVAATGVKIHNRARELSLEKERASVAMFIVDLFVMPFVTVGQWIIAGLMKFNIVVLAINLLIELPFQLFVEFLENLRGFVAVKKDEIR